MGFFECCHQCKAPKRHPGCHGQCPEYLESKKLWDEHKDAERQAKSAEPEMSPAHIRSIKRIHRYQEQNRKLY